jgi:hypothetical protein
LPIVGFKAEHREGFAALKCQAFERTVGRAYGDGPRRKLTRLGSSCSGPGSCLRLGGPAAHQQERPLRLRSQAPQALGHAYDKLKLGPLLAQGDVERRAISP